MKAEPYDPKVRRAQLQKLIDYHELNLHDVWLLGIILSEGFGGMIKFTGARVVLHVKHQTKPKKAKP